MGAYLSSPITTKESEDGQSHRLRYGVSAMQGWRRTMEDAHVAVTELEQSMPGRAALFGVFDGHGGREVAHFVARHLAEELTREGAEYKSGKYADSLIAAFHRMDDLLRDERYDAELKALRSGNRSRSPSVAATATATKPPTPPASASANHTHAHATHAKPNTHKLVTRDDGSGGDMTTKAGGGAKMSAQEAIEMLQKILTISAQSQQQQPQQQPQLQQGGAPSSSTAQPPQQRSSPPPDRLTPVEDPEEREDVSAEGHHRRLVSPVPFDSSVSPSDAVIGRNNEQQKGARQRLEQTTTGDDDDDDLPKPPERTDRADSTVSPEERAWLATLPPGSGNEGAAEPPQPPPPSSPPRNGDCVAVDTEDDDAIDAEVEDVDDEEDEDHESGGALPAAKGRLNQLALPLRAALGGGKLCSLPDHRVQAGCTSVVALLVGNDLYIANAGDSRAVLSRAGKAVALSEDHKPLQPRELSRIHRAGGFVTDAGRVNGNLNLSRSIGDLKYKCNAAVAPKDQMITAEPDVTVTRLNPDTDEFLVLACDGIWDCKSNQEVVDFVRERLDIHRVSSIAEDLIDTCLSDDPRRSTGIGGDNMTCLIVDLRRPEAWTTKLAELD